MGAAGAKGVKREELRELSTSTAFSVEALEDLLKCFKALDKDHSGELDRNEFRQLWSTRFAIRNTSPAQVDRYFEAFDTDGSGTVSFKEFATALSVLGPGTKEQKLRYLFNVYDEDHNGRLTADEIDKILTQMYLVAFALGRTTEKDSDFIRGILKKLDANKDGEISLEEWVTIGSRTPSLLLFLGVISEGQL